MKDQMISGMAWRGLERFGSTFVQFVISIVMARLLLPEQFGIMAMLAVLVELSGVFVESEFSTALIQKKESSHTSECSVFFYNLAVAGIIYLVLFFAAPMVSRFYGEVQLTLVLRVLSLKVIIVALGLVPRALLTKHVDFRRLLVVGWGSILTGALTGIALAAMNFGVWALVAQQLATATAGTMLLWTLSSWRPAWRFSFSRLGELFGYGSKLLASRLMSTVFDNLYLVAIGKLFSPAALGFYHRGSNLPLVLIGPVSDTVSTVLFPSYAAMQNDPELMHKAARRSLNLLYVILTPLLVGLCMTAEPMVRLLLTEKWLPCVPYVRIISLSCLFLPFHIINLQVIRALGRSDLFLRVELVNILIDIAVIAICYRFGLLVLILGQLATSPLAVVVNSFYSRRFIGYSTVRQLLDAVPVTLIAGLMAAVVWMVGLGSYGNEVLRLALQVVCGAGVYIGACYFFKLESFFQTIDLFKEYVLQKRGLVRHSSE